MISEQRVDQLYINSHAFRMGTYGSNGQLSTYFWPFSVLLSCISMNAGLSCLWTKNKNKNGANRYKQVVPV